MKYGVSLALLFVTQTTFAMFCPNGFNQINFGDTIDQVKLQCGSPSSQKTYKSEDSGPQEWTYYVNPTENASVYGQPWMYGATPQTAVKMTIAFNENKVLNITANGMSLPSTQICGSMISVNDTPAQIKAACGKPTMVNKPQQSAANAIEMTEFKYDSAPPITLIFENGKLKERK